MRRVQLGFGHKYCRAGGGGRGLGAGPGLGGHAATHTPARCHTMHTNTLHTATHTAHTPPMPSRCTCHACVLRSGEIAV